MAALLEQGFEDFFYSACAHGGPRCKEQRTRGNADEMAAISSECHHVHDPTAWDPRWDNEAQKWDFPSHGEAESTADLAYHFACALSLDVIRVRGYKLPLITPPTSKPTGDRFQLPRDEAACRAPAMVSLGLRLGLRQPPGEAPERAPRLFRVGQLAEWPEDALCIGSGAHRFCKAPGRYAFPCLVGPHGSAHGVLERYQAYVDALPLSVRSAWSEGLAGRTLVCDCSPGTPCTGEVLYQLALHPCSRHPLCPVRPPVPSATTAMVPLWAARAADEQTDAPQNATQHVSLLSRAAAAAQAMGSPSAPSQLLTIRWPQHALDLAVRKLFPREYTQHLQFPNL